MRPDLRHKVALGLAVLVVGLYLHWMSRVSGGHFTPDRDLNGYYDLLGRAFAAGRLSLPVEPSPQLLALANPWDPRQNEPYRMHDAALFNRKYYLYHGAGPAILLFAPWRLITGRDLPEYYGLFLIVLIGFLFWSGALVRLLGWERTTVLAIVALGVGSGAPYLLNRVAVYEIAIAGGYLCLGAGAFFLCGRQLVAAGVFFGLAVACRPHLGLVGLIAGVYLIWRDRDWRPGARLFAGMIPVGLAIASYNFLRFGNPFEFGVRYLLAGEPEQQRVVWRFANLFPGLYYFLICPPSLDPVFPWIRIVRRFPYPNFPFPREYFLESTVGAAFLSPLILFAPWSRPIGRVIGLSALAVLVFLMGTGFTTQRYFVDFVPLLLFAGIAALDRIPGPVFAAAAVAAIALNLALAITGPYDGYLENRPASYLRLASAFSPVARYRPVSNPPIDVSVRITPEPMPDGIRQPIVSAGMTAFRYLLFAAHQGGKLTIVSMSNASTQTCADGLSETTPHIVDFRYRPETQTASISVDGGTPVDHRLEGGIVSAPYHIRFGQNLAYRDYTVPKFLGKFEVLRAQTPR